MSGPVTSVGQGNPAYLTGFVYGNKNFLDGLKAILFPGDDCVAETVAAAVGVQISLDRLPARVPDAVAVLDIIVVAPAVHGAVVIAVSGQAEKLGIFIETVATGRVGNQSEKVLGSQVVNPGEGSFRSSNNILSFLIVKMSILHDICHPFLN